VADPTGLRILVCVKRVPAPGARINLTADGSEVDATHLGFTTSPHEECALEAAVQLVEAHGGHTTVMTLGPAAAEEQLRYGVSVGAQRAVLVEIDGPDWDPQATARALTDTIIDLEATDGLFDLILFGNESADSGGFQVGIRVGHALDVADEVARVRREVEAGLEQYELPLPAVVGIKEGINLPRYPTMRGRLASKKAEVTTVEPEHRPGGQRLVRLERPVEQVSDTVILGRGPDAAAAVVDLLDELGVLP
jgi:electron transfer flavoprotein beta subunit